MTIMRIPSYDTDEIRIIRKKGKRVFLVGTVAILLVLETFRTALSALQLATTTTEFWNNSSTVLLHSVFEADNDAPVVTAATTATAGIEFWNTSSDSLPPLFDADNDNAGFTTPNPDPDHPVADADLVAADDDVGARDVFSWERSCLPRDQKLNGTGMEMPSSSSSYHAAGRLWTCGYPAHETFVEWFPEYANHSVTTLKRENVDSSQPDDLLIVGFGGFCDGRRDKKLGAHWMSEHFRGTTLHINGEPYGGEPWLNRTTNFLPRQYHLGYVGDSCQSIRIPFLTQVLLSWPTTWLQSLTNHSVKPKNSKEAFLLYTAGNCVPFRERAFASLSKVGSSPAHYGGECHGADSPDIVPSEDVQKTPFRVPKRGRWRANTQLYSHYRYCLVLENQNLDGYLTEKILLAFLAGCIPIYFGSEKDVFHMFNADAWNNPLGSCYWHPTYVGSLKYARYADLGTNCCFYDCCLSAVLVSTDIILLLLTIPSRWPFTCGRQSDMH